jgi:polar amino acid transport system substrate-binding protein
MRVRTVRRAAVLLAATAALAACVSPSRHPVGAGSGSTVAAGSAPSAGSAGSTLAAGSGSAATATARPAADTSCGDPTASLRPTAALPAAKKMPAGSFMAAISARGRLRVGTSQDTLLFSSRNPFTGTVEGFDIDIARQVARAIFGNPDKIQIVVIPNSARIPDVRAGTVDLVAETMTINCARDKLVDFSTVYYDSGQKILVPSTSGATSLADLGGKRVCAAAGATSLDAITAAPSHPIAVTQPSWGDCLVAFQQNRVDAISTDDTILAGLAAQDPYAKVAGAKFTDEPYGLAINQQHPEFTRFVNAVLARDRADGTWTAIYRRWLAKYGTTSTPPAAHYRD